MAGLVLDPWQQRHLTAALGEAANGQWAAFEVGLVVPRQNGKNGELEARQLTGLFLLESLLQIHSAHMADTSVEQFLRLEALIEGTPEFSRRVKKMTRGKGTESIQLHRHPRTGRAPRITFRTRTGGGGRGFSCDDLYFDEAMILPEAFHGALMPTLSARPNPQVWYTGSPPDEEVHPDGVVLARARERALKGNDPSLVYAEHSANAEHPDRVTEEMAADPARWAEANPALGIRISTEHIAHEQRSMSRRAFAVERLGVGAWPRTDGLDGVVIAPEIWAKHGDPDSRTTGSVCFALDVAPDRSYGAIGVAGQRADDHGHVEVVEHKRGTGWMVERAVNLVRSHRPLALVLDASGAAASLIPDLVRALKEAAGGDLLATLPEKELTLVNAKEHAQACGMFYDAVDQDTLFHLGTNELAAAIAGAVKRPLGEAWAWSRKNSSIDISPLVAITLAYWGAQTQAVAAKPEVIDLNEVLAEMRADGEEI